MRIQISGRLKTEKAQAAIRKGAARGIPDALQLLLGESRAQVPVRTGHLRDSGKVEAEGDMGLVAYTADYAVQVHENLTAHHTNGSAKFLENAANDGSVQHGMLEKLGTAMREAMQG